MTLDDIRREIDRIDAQMHRLLIERSEVIERLIEIKRGQGGGSAFRPAREAAMLRAIVERHSGRLPVDTVEGIWRIIISTFTYVQAPYAVHIDVSRGEAAIRDSERFHFGFTVPCRQHFGAAGVIGAVAESSGDLGMFALDGGAAAGAWWMRLADPDAPKVIARLPFVERPDHPAGLPVYVISKPLNDGGAREVVLEALWLDRWRPDFASALRAAGGETIGDAAHGAGFSVLVARAGDLPADAMTKALKDAGARDVRAREVGSHAPRFEMGR
ncbi:MAG: chorismate mutase [Pseudomonadota bacterium]|nr:chorismate mutase [Pseudomonadota bacterium]